MKKYWIIKACILPMVIIIDMVTKFLFEGKDIMLIPNFISILSHHNTGAAWGILSGKLWILIIVTVLFVGAIIGFDIWQKIESKLYSVAIAFIVGGAIGNIIDRIAFGYVRDFIKLEFMEFPIFNFADSFLCVGVVLLIIYLLFFYKDKKKVQ